MSNSSVNQWFKKYEEKFTMKRSNGDRSTWPKLNAKTARAFAALKGEEYNAEKYRGMRLGAIVKYMEDKYPAGEQQKEVFQKFASGLKVYDTEESQKEDKALELQEALEADAAENNNVPPPPAAPAAAVAGGGGVPDQPDAEEILAMKKEQERKDSEGIKQTGKFSKPIANAKKAKQAKDTLSQNIHGQAARDSFEKEQSTGKSNHAILNLSQNHKKKGLDDAWGLTKKESAIDRLINVKGFDKAFRGPRNDTSHSSAGSKIDHVFKKYSWGT
jgi:hypothetical protein